MSKRHGRQGKGLSFEELKRIWENDKFPQGHSKRKTQPELAEELGVDVTTVNRNLKRMRRATPPGPAGYLGFTEANGYTSDTLPTSHNANGSGSGSGQAQLLFDNSGPTKVPPHTVSIGEAALLSAQRGPSEATLRRIQTRTAEEDPEVLIAAARDAALQAALRRLNQALVLTSPGDPRQARLEELEHNLEQLIEIAV